jgi:hypothetical protein
MECIKGIGPEYGWASFDNIGTASLTVFTIIALEGWTEILYVPVLSGWSIALCTCARVQVAGCDVRGVCAELQIAMSPSSSLTSLSREALQPLQLIRWLSSIASFTSVNRSIFPVRVPGTR